MILNINDYKLYRKADLIIAGIDNLTIKQRIKFIFFKNEIDNFMYLLRKSEYYKNCSKFLVDKILFAYYYSKYRKKSLKLGFTIPLNVFGPGLLIPHYGTIVINNNTIVGKCCVLHTCVCIAGNENKVIGDFAYFSKGVTVSGSLTIADGVTISTNSFVNKSCLNDNVLLGGVPAKILKERTPWYISDGKQYFERVDKIISLFINEH